MVGNNFFGSNPRNDGGVRSGVAQLEERGACNSEVACANHVTIAMVCLKPVELDGFKTIEFDGIRKKVCWGVAKPVAFRAHFAGLHKCKSCHTYGGYRSGKRVRLKPRDKFYMGSIPDSTNIIL